MKKLWILIIMLEMICSTVMTADSDGEVELELDVSLEIEAVTEIELLGEFDFGIVSISPKTIKSSEVMIIVNLEDESYSKGYDMTIPKEVVLKDKNHNILRAKLKFVEQNAVKEDPDDSTRWRARWMIPAVRSGRDVDATIDLKGDEQIGSYEGDVVIRGRVY